MNNRGHTEKDVENASRLIKEYGFSLGLQMMTGLYMDTDEKTIMTVMKKIMHQNSENQTERLLEKPFWVIDFLPEQVSAERSKQYFAVEDFCCNSQYINQLYQNFAYLIIKLSCYFDIFGNPSPNEIFDSNHPDTFFEPVK